MPHNFFIPSFQLTLQVSMNINTGSTQKQSSISSSYRIKTYWNILTKLVATVAQTHTVSCGITHTECALLLLLGKHQYDNLARTRLSAAYPAWPSWQLLRDRRSVWMSLSLITDTSSFNEIPVKLQNGFVSRRIHIKFAFESTLHTHNTVCFMKLQHAPAALLWNERHLAFHCHLAAGRDN
jgi:hypothetical protein